MDSKRTAFYIGDLAARAGISTRAIRYYEELGILRPTRTEGGYRLYSERDLDLLVMVLRFKDLGMTLEEIQGLVALRSGHPNRDALLGLRDALLARKREFEERIEKFKQAIEQMDSVMQRLSRCRTCGAPSERESCERCLREGGEGSPLL
jgi:DNA-binding transcriptional MerR regulator